jgi:hypothetical protein
MEFVCFVCSVPVILNLLSLAGQETLTYATSMTSLKIGGIDNFCG